METATTLAPRAPPIIPPRARSRPTGKLTCATNLAHKPSTDSAASSSPRVTPSTATAKSNPHDSPQTPQNAIVVDTPACESDSVASSISGNGPETPASAQVGPEQTSATRRASDDSGLDGDFAANEKASPPTEAIAALTTDLQSLGIGAPLIQNVAPGAARRKQSTTSLPGTNVSTKFESIVPRSSSLNTALPDQPPALTSRSNTTSRGSPLVGCTTPPLGSQFKLGLAAPIQDSAIRMQSRTASGTSVDTAVSASSTTNQEYVTAFHSRSSSLTGATIGSATPPMPSTSGNYVTARMARELDRKKEIETNRKKQRDDSVGVVVKEDGTVVRDGHKIIDGVAKKAASSGVYTPPTFPGPGGGARTPDTAIASTSPYDPASETMIPASSAAGSHRSSRFLTPSSASYRKSTFGAALANLASPLLSPREQHTPEPSMPATPSSASGRMSTDAWRTSPLYSPARGQPDRYRSPVAYRATTPGGDGIHPDRSPLSGVYVNDSGRVVPSAQRMRVFSEALHGCHATEGHGLGIGIPIRDRDANPRSFSEGGWQSTSLTAASQDSVPPPQRPRNVKGLTLPLTTAMASNALQSPPVIDDHQPATAQVTSPQVTSPQSISSPMNTIPGTPASAAAPAMTSARKRVKRKPVPMEGSGEQGVAM